MKFSKLAFVLGLFAAGANALSSNELAPQDLNDGQLEAIDETTNSEDAASLDETANLEARAVRTF